MTGVLFLFLLLMLVLVLVLVWLLVSLFAWVMRWRSRRCFGSFCWAVATTAAVIVSRLRRGSSPDVSSAWSSATAPALFVVPAIVSSAAPGPGGGDNLVISNFREMASQVIGDKRVSMNYMLVG